MNKECVRNKNVLLAFSDPAGAKAVLAFARLNRHLFKTVRAVSDRVYDFYRDFDVDVESLETKTPTDWLNVANIDVLITGTSFPSKFEVALLQAARRAGVLSISFIDHWTNMALRFLSEGSLVLPDWICVIDEHARRLALADGLPADKIVVTGNPHHEFLKQWRPTQSRQEILHNTGLPPQAHYVLYAPEPLLKFGLDKKYGFDELDGLKMISVAMKASPQSDRYVIVKGHPNLESANLVDHLAKLHSDRIIYHSEGDVASLIFYAECVVGFFSNSLVEASVLGKQVVRPLMKLRDNAVDVLAAMESSRFLSIRDADIFARTIFPRSPATAKT